jgi:hypothetical protein
MRTISLEQLIKYTHLAHSFFLPSFLPSSPVLAVFWCPQSLFSGAPTADVPNPLPDRKHYPKTQAWPSHVLSSIVLLIISCVGSRGSPESEYIGSAGSDCLPRFPQCLLLVRFCLSHRSLRTNSEQTFQWALFITKCTDTYQPGYGWDFMCWDFIWTIKALLFECLYFWFFLRIYILTPR